MSFSAFCCIILFCGASCRDFFQGGNAVFENIVFDESCKRKIEHSIKSKTFPHAVILEGANAETRLSAAKEIACALVCTGEEKPCGICRACKKAKSGNHPDIYIFQKDDSAAAIKVDDVRLIREKALLLPNDGDKSIFIISEAQFMNPQAQNALLKIFEEPAPHVCFILTCPSRTAFLDTITSRAAAFMLSQEENFKVNGEESKEALDLAKKLIDVLCSSNEFEFLKETSVFLKNKELFKAVLPFLIYIFRDALVKNEPLTDCKEQAENLRRVFTQKKLLSLIEETKLLMDAVEKSANHNLTITRLCSVFYRIKNN